MSARHFSFTMLVVLSVAVLVRAEDTPLDIIDRAIKARGGAELLERVTAAEMKMKGTVRSRATPAQDMPFTAVSLSQRPDQFKHVMVYSQNGASITQVQIFSGANLWVRIDNRVLNLDNDLRDALQRLRYVDGLSQLTILRNKEFQLTAQGESKVEGKPVLGIKVAATGRPDVLLFFDKATGLLVKTEHKQLDVNTRQEAIQEVFYSDYRTGETAAEDVKILQNGKIKTDDADLLQFLRSLTGASGDPERIRALIRQLGDDQFDRREKAGIELVALGAVAIPFLQAALKDPDLEISRRAGTCLKQIKGVAKKLDAGLPAAAARLLAARKPAGAVAVLLDYLPAANEEAVAREVRAALAAVAQADGKPDPVLLKALEHKDAARRLAAAEALGRVPLPPGRKMFALDRLKRPTHISVYRAGNKFMDWQITETIFINKLDDKVFGVPIP